MGVYRKLMMSSSYRIRQVRGLAIVTLPRRKSEDEKMTTSISISFSVPSVRRAAAEGLGHPSSLATYIKYGIQSIYPPQIRPVQPCDVQP